jgi:DNA-binding NtrC family response regulator
MKEHGNLGFVTDEATRADRLPQRWVARGFGTLVGDSAPMKALYETLSTVGPSNASVLVVGESGTGKELVARMLHDLSDRRSRRFVALNCAAVPETLMESELFGHEKGAFTGAIDQKPGCFELANGGTLFLDELSAMPIASQVKLLRVLEERSFRRLRGVRELVVDIRVVAAMNEDPEIAVDRGRLRPDLLFRLNVFTLRLPPLRERVSDIPILASHFADTLGAANGKRLLGIDPDALHALTSFHWPGNVRELRNVIERAVILEKGPRLSSSGLAFSLRPKGSLSTSAPAPPPAMERSEPIASIGMSLDEVTRRMILRTLEATQFNRTKAAALLGVSAKTIYNKLKEWEIDVDSRSSKTRVGEASARVAPWTLPSHEVPFPG